MIITKILMQQESLDGSAEVNKRENLIRLLRWRAGYENTMGDEGVDISRELLDAQIAELSKSFSGIEIDEIKTGLASK